MNKLILIDGNAVIHRAFHAIPPFKTSNGEPINAVYGFTSILLNLLNFEKPDYIAVSFDMKGKTFRHEEYAEYKATRVKAPDELYSQIPRIKEIVKTFEIPIFEVSGFEADDVLGTLSRQAEAMDDINTFIFTGDMDALQLVSEKTFVLAPKQGIKDPVVYNIEKVFERHGLKPAQVPEMKGLQGDSSDNIKGVQGIGKKTAQTLLQKYGTLENIYEHLDEISGKLKERLADGKEDAFFSRRLATIITDVPITLDLEPCKAHDFDFETLQSLFNELEFKSLLPRLGSFNRRSQEKRAAVNQATLF